MNARLKKIICVLLAGVLLFASGRMQAWLNQDRDALGLTRNTVLENAPPVLAFTTIALGGFRGIISNFLWIRANDLQQDDKFFEAAQLADWITKLEPTFTQVWLFQGWNMAYNISVKFKDPTDRWRWVENGIELLRDDGLKYNENNVLIHRELAWFFQHKMGANLDDANMYYKARWAQEMMPFFGPGGTNFTALLNPVTPTERTNALVLRDRYKIDAKFAKSVDEKYGPLDWRLPEAHAIYWGRLGLDDADKNPGKVKSDDLITLRRIIYQSLLQSMHHGRLTIDPYTRRPSLTPNLEVVPILNETYEEMFREETQAGQRDGILKAQRNFLRDAVYFLYEANRISDAQKWFKYLGDKFPDKPVIENQPDSLPRTLTLDEYAVAVVQIDIGETSQDRVTAAVQSLLIRAYYDLAIGEDDRYENLKRLANRVYQRYTQKTSGFNGADRIPLPPYNQLNSQVLTQLLDPDQGIPYAARAALRTQLGLPAEPQKAAAAPTTAPAPGDAATNAAPEVTTNPAPTAIP